MKILIVLALMLAANPYLMAQKYEVSSEKLIEQFAEIYKKTDKKANFFERMAAAGGIFFGVIIIYYVRQFWTFKEAITLQPIHLPISFSIQ